MSIFDHPDSVQPAPSWRCPECRTLQAETTQCWRCDKPAFTCETCGLFRPSVAANLGYCANDPARTPLPADETRSCWEAAGVPGLGATAVSGSSQPRGLFADAEIAPPSAPLSMPSSAPPIDPGRGTAGRVTPKPPLEDPGRAAWVEPESDALVEAPSIEPGKRLTTEVQRRRRRWFR